jgi:hypothetical protein
MRRLKFLLATVWAGALLSLAATAEEAAAPAIVAPGAPAESAPSAIPAAPMTDAVAAPAPAEAASPAAAAPDRDEGAEAAAEAKAKVAADDPVVCRTEAETGSRIRKNKICMKKSQWEAQREAARRYKQSIEQSRSTQPGGGG